MVFIVRKKIILQRGAVSLIVAVIFYLGFSSILFQPLQEAYYRQLIGRNTPVGSSASKVISFLKFHNMEHSDAIIDSTCLTCNGPVIYAAVRNTSSSFIEQTDTLIRFYFDGNNKLIRFEVTRGSTGP